MRNSALVLFALAACARATPAPQRAQGYRANLEEADAHDRDAEVHDRAAAEADRAGVDGYVCGDRAMSDQTTSGGVPVTHWVPCWSAAAEDSAAHRATADRLRAEARAHRASARMLVDVERTFCADLPEDELTHTPFIHRDDIAAVVPYRTGGQLVGAQITWKPVRGLTADWLRTALMCHRARLATLGYPPTYMAYDPSMLLATQLAVTTDHGALIVTIRGDDDVTAAVVWSRAQALVAPTPR